MILFEFFSLPSTSTNSNMYFMLVRQNRYLFTHLVIQVS